MLHPKLAAPAALFLASCSAFVSSQQGVQLDGGDPRTTIHVDGVLVGQGEAQLELARDRSHVVIFERDGQQDIRIIDHRWSTYGQLDVIGSVILLFPGFGLLCPGARELEPRELTAQLAE